MKAFRILAGAALAVLSVNALGGPAFEISGLHVGLIFTDAVAQAEQLGGVCQQGKSGRRGGGIIARCDYLQCAEGSLSDGCSEQNPKSSGFAIASQPVIQVVLEAAAASSSITRIAISFEGSLKAVAGHLKQEFGPPLDDTFASTEGSWSHSRRLAWKQGYENLGLLDITKKIMLTADPVRRELDPDAL
jgi:hypothetical protein